jgi:hypothetical protein
VKKGDGDIELFEVVNDILKRGHQRVDSLIAAREKAVIEKAGCNAHDSDVQDNGVGRSEDEEDEAELGDVCFLSDGEALRNKYGAVGSSARMSDSEIMKIKAPLIKRKCGCPRGKRFMSMSSGSKKKKADMRLKEGPKSSKYSVSFDTSYSLLSSCVGNENQTTKIGDAEHFFSTDDYARVRGEAEAAAKALEIATTLKKKSKKEKSNKSVFSGGKMSHLISEEEPSASHMCARISSHTYDRQK